MTAKSSFAEVALYCRNPQKKSITDWKQTKQRRLVIWFGLLVQRYLSLLDHTFLLVNTYCIYLKGHGLTEIIIFYKRYFLIDCFNDRYGVLRSISTGVVEFQLISAYWRLTVYGRPKTASDEFLPWIDFRRLLLQSFMPVSFSKQWK